MSNFRQKFSQICFLTLTLVGLVFLTAILISRWSKTQILAAGPVLAVNPKSLDFGDVYFPGNIKNRLRVLICNFGGTTLNINSISFNYSVFFLQNIYKDSVPISLPATLDKTGDTANSDICDSLDGPNKIEAIIGFNPTAAGFTATDAKLTIDTNELPDFDIFLKGKGINNNIQRAKTWLEAKYGDVYAVGDLYAEYTNTDTTVDYRIVSGSTIDNWQSQQNTQYETVQFISSFPDSDNNFTVSAGQVDTLGLITADPLSPGKNKYGYDLTDLSAPADAYIGSADVDPTAAPYNYNICQGDLVIGDNVFSNDDIGSGKGSELIAVKGNIYIIGDTYYSADRPTKIEDLASLGFMVLKRDAGLPGLEPECQPATATGCETATLIDECFDSDVNKLGGNIYLADVHNLKTNGGYIIGVDYNNFYLEDGADPNKGIENNTNYCAETGEYPGKKMFDLDGSGDIAGNAEIYLGWDDYFGNPAGGQNPYYIDTVYDYCQRIETPQLDPTLPGFPAIISYNINDTLSPNPDTMTVAPIHIVGTYYVEGSFHSGKAKLPLIVEGLVMAKSFHLEREAIVQNPSGALSPSEIFIYDGRAILNPPPGFRELINERFNFSLVKP